MLISEAFFLLVISALGGALNSVAGGGSFIIFPALLLMGIPPVSANATNTVAVWPGSVAGSVAFRRELSGRTGTLLPFLLASVLGSLAGAMLLLVTPEKTFSFMVPYLLLAATLVFAFGRRFTRLPAFFPGGGRLPLLLQFLISVYGGFFGAGIGILMLAMLEVAGYRHIHQMNAIKTVLATAINGVAVAAFSVAGIVLWKHAAIMAMGAIAGGYLGAHYSRMLPGRVVRVAIIIYSFGMTGYFFL